MFPPRTDAAYFPLSFQVTKYADDLPSDEDSQDGIDAEDAADDSSGDSDEADEARSSNDSVDLLLLEEGARARTSFDEGGAEVGGATPARKALDADEAGKAFLRTILSLSNADAGLLLLRQAFAQRMTMRDPLDGLSPARAAKAQQAFEHDALMSLLKDDLKLEHELAAVVRAEVMRKPTVCPSINICCPLSAHTLPIILSAIR
jgi:hypothetical protein